MKFLLLFCQFLVVYCLSCIDILEWPENRKLSLEELQSIAPKEVVQCLAHLGKEKLPTQDAEFIWYSIVRFYGSIAEVPDKVLMHLHWVTPALTPDDYMNITLNDIDVIQNFGLNYGLEDEQLSAIADRVREDFAGKKPEDYTYYDLTAMRQILCAFNQSEIERIHPASYREAALVIGKLERCQPDVMQQFANLAVHPSAFGPPATWSHNTMEAIGKVADFLAR